MGGGGVGGADWEGLGLMWGGGPDVRGFGVAGGRLAAGGIGEFSYPCAGGSGAQGVDSGPLAWGCSGRQSQTLRGPG